MVRPAEIYSYKITDSAADDYDYHHDHDDYDYNYDHDDDDDISWDDSYSTQSSLTASTLTSSLSSFPSGPVWPFSTPESTTPPPSVPTRTTPTGWKRTSPTLDFLDTTQKARGSSRRRETGCGDNLRVDQLRNVLKRVHDITKQVMGQCEPIALAKKGKTSGMSMMMKLMKKKKKNNNNDDDDKSRVQDKGDGYKHPNDDNDDDFHNVYNRFDQDRIRFASEMVEPQQQEEQDPDEDIFRLSNDEILRRAYSFTRVSRG